MNENQVAEFTGWALVEIMGHNKLAGYVETVAYGSVVMFKVSAPEMAPVEQTLEKSQYIGYQTVHAGSIVRVSREAFETQVGASSVYRMTRCTEAQALSQIPQKIEVITMAETPKRLVAAGSADEDDEDERPF